MSEFIAQFHFLRPHWLLALIPIAAFIAWFWWQRKAGGDLQKYIAPHLLQWLQEGRTSRSNQMLLLGLAALWLTMCISLAGPTWSKKEQALERDQSALVIVWDMSPSMAAEDLKPSRAERSRYKIVDLLEQRDEGTTALVAYAGEAHVVTPLTDDIRTVKNLMRGIHPNMMPVSGSNTEMAMRTARSLLEDSGVGAGHILLVTDGIHPSAHTTLQEIIVNTAHEVYVWGVGTNEGGPVPLANRSGYAKDRNGNIHISQRDDEQLSQAAVSMGGLYVPFSQASADVDMLTGELEKTAGKLTGVTDREFDQWQEYGIYLLFAALPLAALAFRRGWLMILPLAVVFSAPKQVEASPVERLLLNSEQQAEKALERQDFATARQKRTDPEWQATVEYRAGNFDKAAELYPQDNADSLYNRGNALTRAGDYEGAIDSYRQALSMRDNFQEAEDNLRIAQQLKELEQQSQSPQNNQQNQDSQQQEQQQDQAGSDQQSQQNQPQQGNQSEQSQQSTGQPGQQDEQQSDSGSSEEEQKALKDAFNRAENAEPNQDEAEEADENQTALPDPERNANEQNANREPGERIASSELTEEEAEQLEAMEQWLRKVPDDPAALLRNKFYYEARKRRQERGIRSRLPTESDPRNRW